jgi:hypothetical protein
MRKKMMSCRRERERERERVVLREQRNEWW